MRKAIAVALVALVMVVYGYLRVSGNAAQRGNVPAACQLFGGHWSLWNGWQCY